MKVKHCCEKIWPSQVDQIWSNPILRFPVDISSKNLYQNNYVFIIFFLVQVIVVDKKKITERGTEHLMLAFLPIVAQFCVVPLIKFPMPKAPCYARNMLGITTSLPSELHSLIFEGWHHNLSKIPAKIASKKSWNLYCSMMAFSIILTKGKH